MTEGTASGRNARGEWRPEEKIAVPPINHWPPRPGAVMRWLIGFPGYLWPTNAVWLAVTLAIWTWLTPELAAMKSLELWWIVLLLGRNLGFILLLYGGLHLYLYVYERQGEAFRFNLKPLATDSGRFLFRRQVRDNMFHALVFGVPVVTGYEVLTYWGFANGTLGYVDAEAGPLLFWSWLVFLLVLTPVVHSVHFYFAHRLLHVRFLYRKVHVLHHHNVEVGPWSGLAMHPVEHILYFSTVVVQWLVALHPVNALFQIHIAVFNAAMAHTGFEKLKIGPRLAIDGGSYFHYLHHKYFECNYGGSLASLDKFFGTFHDGSDEAQAAMRRRLRTIREAEA
jgi:sterol desaturase/sphingolipid hydroxylase (fatty acid hydroxylase superfamily)